LDADAPDSVAQLRAKIGSPGLKTDKEAAEKVRTEQENNSSGLKSLREGPRGTASGWVGAFLLDFHSGEFCGLRIYLLALEFVDLPPVESIFRD
jgi:hypothetical protein